MYICNSGAWRTSSASWDTERCERPTLHGGIVPIKISVKGKIVYNGKEYASAGELPEDVRHAYERAMGAADSSDALGKPVLRTKIVFNGHEYGSVDEMPANVRRMYDAVMMTVEESAGHAAAAVPEAGAFTGSARSGGTNLAPTAPIGPESSGSKALLLLTAASLLLLILYVLSNMATSR